MKRVIGATLFLGIGFALGSTADQKGASDAIVADALLAALPAIARQATVLDLDGNVVREGGGRWFCRPGPELDKGHNAMCNDTVFERWVAARTARSEFKTDRIGISYMLAGDEGSNVDPFATAPTADNQWVVEGPHIMIVVPDPAMLEGIPTDPENGGPYVMWKGTPYEHIMVPVAEKLR